MEFQGGLAEVAIGLPVARPEPSMMFSSFRFVEAGRRIGGFV